MLKLNIFAKLIGAFAAVLLLMGIVGWVSVTNLDTMSSLSASMYDDRLVPIAHLGEANASLLDMRRRVLEYLTSDDKSRLSEIEDLIAEDENEMLARIDKYSKTYLVQEERDWLAKFDIAWSAYKADRNTVMGLKREGRGQEAMALASGSAQQKFQSALESLKTLIHVNTRVANEAHLQAKEIAERSRLIVLATLAAAVLVGLGIAVFLARSIANGVGAVAKAAERLATTDLPNLVRVAQAIASGDLTQSLHLEIQQVAVKSSDEVGQMAAAFNKMAEQLSAAGDAFGSMIQSLRRLVSQVTESAAGVSASAEQLSEAANQAGAATQQISTTIQQVAKGSQAQAASSQGASESIRQLTKAIDQITKGAQEQSKAIQETSSIVARMSATITRVSEGSKAVTASAKKAQEAAKSGAVAVDHTVQGMDNIREKVGASARRVQEMGEYSDQIGKIVETIDDIAEQTNLLALNAAIEAARAGEHGKGFAVVADEVRKLAERAARATKEISRIIETVQKGTGEAVTAMGDAAREVDAGSKLSAEAGQALRVILQTVQDTSDQMQAIAAAVSEMTQLSSEVVDSIDSVSAVVEENTAATEEMAAGASDVTRAVENVATVSDENAASAEEVSAGAEEMSAQVEEVVASAESLARMAEELREAVSRFKLDADLSSPEISLQRRKSDWQKSERHESAPKIAAHLRTA